MNRPLRAFGRGQVSTAPLARLPELALVHPIRPLQTVMSQLATSWRVSRLARRTTDRLMREICRRASWDCLTPQVTHAGLLAWVARGAVHWWRPRVFLTLYEGHGWERCAWWGAKQAEAGCLTVGYQHTALFRESLTLTDPPAPGGADGLPDLVLCSGFISLELMRQGHEKYGTRLMTLGSFRSVCASAQEPADPTRRRILVVPEGIPSETQILFEFALRCARRLPFYTFILRSHPELPMRRALELVRERVDLLPNVICSTSRSIEEDFARSPAILYRGSSSVFYAVAQGLLPLYLEVAGTVDTDPLYAIDGWRRRCRDPDDVAACMGEEARMSPEARCAAWRRAAEYVSAYVEPVTDERVDAFLAMSGVRSLSRCTV